MKEKLKQFRRKLKWLDPFTYVDLLLEKYWPVKGKRTLTQEIGYNAVYIVSAFVFALILYTLFSIALQTKSPIVIVVSESMQPVLHRGDIVFLQGLKPAEIKAQEVSVSFPVNGIEFSEFAKAYYVPSRASSIGFEIESIEVNDKNYFPNRQGDIIVYYSIPKNEQIIHRAILKINSPDGTFLLTKGDNSAANFTFDQDKFCVKTNNPNGTFGVKCFESITKFPVDAGKIDGKAVFTIPMLGCVKVWVFDDLPSILSAGRMPLHYTGGLC